MATKKTKTTKKSTKTTKAKKTKKVEKALEVEERDPKIEKKLDKIMSKLDKLYKKPGVVERGALVVDYEGGFSTGFQEIDDILTGSTDEDGETLPGTGVGFPRGRVVEIFGPESSAKTSMCLAAIADCQSKGGVAAFIDAEHALDLHYAARLGVDVEALLIVTPDTAEDGLTAVENFVKAGVDLIVVDSVAALVPEKEVKGDMGDVHVGLQARLMSQALRKLTGLLKADGPSVVFINQIRYKIGVMFGNPETTSGGNALKFYSSIRVDLRRVAQLKKKTKVIGVRIRAKTVKNKCAPPFREIVYDVNFTTGISIPDPEKLKAEKRKKK